ncbi:hypothetical protein F5Y14DRAFT_457645 [Nemania sp. NC0429]|nr:hypothetical protein F5Y14DRAFT_457645 [Nemania sp. NC0429]
MDFARMEFGKRLLPQVVDWYARYDPDKIYASIPRSGIDLSRGFQEITMSKLAAIVNRLAWWLDEILGEGTLESIGYVGPADIRYAAIFLAATKCRYKTLFISPRNQMSQNARMVLQAGCCAVLYGEELATTAQALRECQLEGLTIQAVASLVDLLDTSRDTREYPYNKSFHEVQNEPCLVLHSSGSTGDPKLVTMTHGTLACTDNDRRITVPPGRAPQNAAQFDFKAEGKFYSCFPPYHLAGVHAYIDLPIFYEKASVVFGPSNLPPSGYLLAEILKHQRHLDFILYGGGPLSSLIGRNLSESTSVCQMYGSLEIGQVQLLVPQPGEWMYMEFNPAEEVDMQPCGDGTFEMVLYQDPKFAPHRSLWHNFPGIREWRTNDLFMPHPTKAGLWRFHGRLDELVILSSSHKIRPLEMETIIQGNSLLSGALIAGQGKPEPILIIEPRWDLHPSHSDRETFINNVWPTIVEANKIAPSYAKINRSRILLSDPEKPFLRAPKGTVVRKLTVNAYADAIERAFNAEMANGSRDAGIQSIPGFILPGLKQFVRSQVAEHLQSEQLKDSDNIFLHGLDSLGAISLSRSLQRGLSSLIQTQKGSSTNSISLRLIHKNPSIEKLASLILDLLTNCGIPKATNGSVADEMEHVLTEVTRDLPAKEATLTVLPASIASDGKMHVALIGPRGSLGPNIVRELLDNPRVAEIYCLNRGHDGKERLQSAFEELGLPHTVHDERLFFMPVDLGKFRLGLATTHLERILNKTSVIIHNAWRVDFSWELDTYKDTYLRSIREVIELSSLGRLHPRIAFVSSVSSVQEWAAIFPDSLVRRCLRIRSQTTDLGHDQKQRSRLRNHSPI